MRVVGDPGSAGRSANHSPGSGCRRINGLAFRPSDGSLATFGDDGTLRLWDRSSGAQILRIDHPAGVPFLALSFEAAGERIRATDADREVLLWDAVSGERLE